MDYCCTQRSGVAPVGLFLGGSLQPSTANMLQICFRI